MEVFRLGFERTMSLRDPRVDNGDIRQFNRFNIGF